MDAILKSFISDSLDLLDELESSILLLEKESSKEDINNIFRSVHTIKGNSGLFDLKKITDLTHIFETVLNKVRAGEITILPFMIDIFLDSIDKLRQMISDIENVDNYDTSMDIHALDSILHKTHDGNAKEVKPETEVIKKTEKVHKPAKQDIHVEMSQVNIFLSKISNKIDSIEDAIVSLESDPNIKRMQNLISVFNSISNQANVLKMKHLAELSSVIVETLEVFKQNPVKYNSTIIDLFLLGIDKIRSIIIEPENIEIKDILESFSKYFSKQKKELTTKKKTHISKKEKVVIPKVFFNQAKKEGKYLSFISYRRSNSYDNLNEARQYIETLPEITILDYNYQRSGFYFFLILSNYSLYTFVPPLRKEVKILKELYVPEDVAERVVNSKDDAKSQKPVNKEKKPVQPEDTYLKIPSELVGDLINLAGETIIARNEIIQKIEGFNDPSLTSSGKKISQLITRLQEGIMRTRMQKLGLVFGKIPRIVRDCERSTGKKINLTITGEDLDLDKKIIDTITDPIMHMIRNSIDHGIEAAEDRIKKGKPKEGFLEISAQLKGGNIILKIKDDGKGFDTGRIKNKAIKIGLITNEAAENMDKEEILNLIFKPGFSTSENVTTTSGRGVGMDVVQSNIHKAGGSIEINTEPGSGSIITATLPQTLSIITCHILKVADRRFALPQQNMDRLMKLQPDNVSIVEKRKMYELPDKLIPLFDLREILEIPTQEAGTDIPNKYVVIVKSEQFYYGLIIDEIINSEEIVIKPLGDLFSDVALFSGATIMGDGEAILILDVPGIGREMKIPGRKHEIEKIGYQEKKKLESKAKSFVIFEVSNMRFAISAKDNPRIDKISSKQLRDFVGNKTLTYNNSIVPLLNLEKYYNFIDQREFSNHLFVILFQYNNKTVGIIVDQIVNVLDQLPILEKSGYTDATIEGSAIIENVATLFINRDELSKLYFNQHAEYSKAMGI